MEAVVLCEMTAGRDDAREIVLARLGRLVLGGRAVLSFVGRDPGTKTGVMAVAFASMAEAERFVADLSAAVPAPATARLIALDPVAQAVMPAMFP